MKNNWVSLLALLVSIIALMLSYRVVPIDFKDYWGFVLGILSLFVTLLIGWQIFTSLDINRKMSNIDKMNLLIASKQNKIDQLTTKMHAEIYYAQAAAIMQQLPVTAYKSFLLALYYSLKSGENERVNSILGTMDSFVSELNRIYKEELEIPSDINTNLAIVNENGEDCALCLKKEKNYQLIRSKYELIENGMICVVEKLRERLKET